jgi:glutamate formiminotransferase/formiminotetrahydrofolate cyclodeaminase
VRIAVKSMGLDELAPFDPHERIIEWAMKEPGTSSALMSLTTQAFVEKVASESPAPGGGSVAALVGSLGAALGTMVANLSAHKRGWDDRWEEFSAWAEKGTALHTELSRLVDEDTIAFDAIMSAFGLPQGSDEEKAARTDAIEAATRAAIEVPLKTMEASLRAMEITKSMAENGNPNSASDAGVGALCARAAVRGAMLNVQTNCASLKDKGFVAKALERAEKMAADAEKLENDTLAIVTSKM